MPVEDQLAIALYRFGHNGNAASLQSVANWAGVGKGTVTLCTRRVMVAVLRPTFMREAVRFPTEAEKDDAKAWVAAHSCQAWRHGWCLVDGTLIPLAERPNWFGESYFDRKCNYSLNVQVYLHSEMNYNSASPFIRSSLCPICGSLTLAMATLEVHMIPPHGLPRALPKSTKCSWKRMSGFGQTPHTQYFFRSCCLSWY
jgi:hypothetical protein